MMDLQQLLRRSSWNFRLKKGNIKKIDLIEELVELPKYTSSSGIKKAVIREVVERLLIYLLTDGVKYL